MQQILRAKLVLVFPNFPLPETFLKAAIFPNWWHITVGCHAQSRLGNRVLSTGQNEDRKKLVQLTQDQRLCVTAVGGC